MIRLVVDSTADIPAQAREASRITVVPTLLHRGDETLRDGIDLTRDDYYAWLTSSPTLPRTSAPTIGMFAEAFRAGLSEGGTLICITLAAALSATHAAARQAADLVDAMRITVIDSQTMAMPISYMALAAAQAAEAGAGHAEVVALVESLRTRTVAYIGLDTLHYLEKGGRIGKVQAWLGTLLSVKPILEVRDSAIRPAAQVRTSKRVPERLIELVEQRGRYTELSVMYTTDYAAATALADTCAARGLLERDRIGVVQIGAVLGTHIGPGALAITGLLHAPR